MPEPTEAHRRLAEFVGTWVGEERMLASPLSPTAGHAKGKITGRMALDGHFLFTDYTQERDGRVIYQGRGVYTWDPDDAQYLMYWFDSAGGSFFQPAPGTWDGSSLVYEAATSFGRARYDYAWESEDRFTFRIDVTQDGKLWSPFLEGTYQRNS